MIVYCGQYTAPNATERIKKGIGFLRFAHWENGRGRKAKLTRFEKARILGARALQIAQGAQAQVKTRAEDPIDIAREENDAGATPMRVVRKIGIASRNNNNKTESEKEED